jgi:hypothetical protein
MFRSLSAVGSNSCAIRRVTATLLAILYNLQFFVLYGSFARTAVLSPVSQGTRYVRFFFFTYTPLILVIIKVFSPTDAQLDRLKNNFKFALKLILKTPTCFGTKHHPQGAHMATYAATPPNEPHMWSHRQMNHICGHTAK